jgi:hypothetical protein
MNNLDLLKADPDYREIVLRVVKLLDTQRDKLVTMAKRSSLEDFKYEGGFHDGVRTALSILQGDVK